MIKSEFPYLLDQSPNNLEEKNFLKDLIITLTSKGMGSITNVIYSIS